MLIGKHVEPVDVGLAGIGQPVLRGRNAIGRDEAVEARVRRGHQPASALVAHQEGVGNPVWRQHELAGLEIDAIGANPQRQTPLEQVEALVVGAMDVRKSLGAIRDEIDELSEGLDEAERIAPTLPSRERYLRLNHRLSRRILSAFSEWLDEVERELS